MARFSDFDFLNNLKPNVMFDYFKNTIRGQDEAIKKFALAIYNHYKRIQINQDYCVNINKNNIFMVGATGSGKTLLVKTLRDYYNLPVFITSATEYTAEGYVGKSVTEIIEDLYEQTKSKGYAENAIVFIDEIDKIASKKTNVGVDVNGEEVQNSLLKIIEGSEIIFKKENSYGEKEKIKINTANILFICAGAFQGIEDIVKERNNGKKTIGLIPDNINPLKDPNITVNDIAKFGFKKEFIGRFNTVIELKKHDKKSLADILINSDDSVLFEFKLRFQEENCDFKVTRQALEEIADIALKLETGARSLNKIFYDIFTDSLSECIINSDKKKKIYVRKEHIINKKIEVKYV